MHCQHKKLTIEIYLQYIVLFCLSYIVPYYSNSSDYQERKIQPRNQLQSGKKKKKKKQKNQQQK